MENGETIESAASNEAEDTKDEAESVGGKNDEDEAEEEEEKEDGDNNNDDDDGDASTGDTKDEDEVSTVPSAPPAEDLQEPWE